MDNITHSKLTQWKIPIIEHNIPTKWNWVVSHPEGMKLGNNTDIGAFTYIDAKYGVIIEDDVQVGGGCHIYSHNTINNTKGSVILKKGCMIGAHSIILPNTVVMPETLIKANSILKGGVYNGKRKTYVEGT